MLEFDGSLEGTLGLHGAAGMSMSIPHPKQQGDFYL